MNENRIYEKHLENLYKAIEIARQNDIHKLSKHGSILLHNKMLFTGMNKNKSHPIVRKFSGKNIYKIYLHAEIDAMISGLKYFGNIEGSTLYVARVFRNGKVAMSKPCKTCMLAILEFGIRRVFWTVGQEDDEILFDYIENHS